MNAREVRAKIFRPFPL